MDKEETTRTQIQQNGITLQILGSGGPFAGNKRASSGYLLWDSGNPLVMIDAGGGTYLRLQQAGVHIEDIKLICISHFHPDHSTELPALLLSDLHSKRTDPLVVSGPTGPDALGLNGFLDTLAGMVSPLDVFSKITRIEAKVDHNRPTEIYHHHNLRVTALGVTHATMPTLSYRFEVGDICIGYGADQLGDNPAFIEFVKGVDLLLMHFSISENANKPVSLVHAKPSVVGKIARQAGVDTLVLSHFIRLDETKPNAADFSLSNLESELEHLKQHYSGTVILAEDLKCIEVK